MFGTGKMASTVVVFALICLATAATGRTITSTHCTREWLLKSFTETKTCVKDFMNRTGSCSDMDQVRKTYISHIEPGCQNFVNVAQTNTSTHLRIAFIEHVLKPAEIKGFSKTNGTKCIQSKVPKILQCIEDTIKDANKTKLLRQMRHSLFKLQPFEFEEKSFVDCAKIFNCTLNILNSSCHQTVNFIRSIENFISKEFVKHKYVKARPSPPAASHSGLITIIVVLVVIILLIMALFVIKEIYTRWRRRSATYRCTYKAGEEENGENNK